MVASVNGQHPHDTRSFVAELRRDVYGFLAGLFVVPVSEDSLTAIRGESGSALFGLLDGGRPLAELREAAARATAAELTQEFWDLFVVPVKKFVTPSESVYLDVREVGGELVSGLLMGESALSVQRVYARAGFEPSRDRPFPPDHLAVELGFISRLAEEERRAHEAGDDVQAESSRRLAKGFLRDHLLRWLPRLSGKVHENAELPFYPALMRLVCAFVEMDSAPDP